MVHPAHLLHELDKLSDEISSNGGLWESKFGKLLRTSSNKLWQPILLDVQCSLRTIGGNLLCLGMVEVVGRPVMMLYPIYLVCVESTQIAKEFETQRRITPQSILQIAKIFSLLLIGYQLITILSMYTGLGYTCLGLGLCALATASSNSLSKMAAPVLAPHLARLDGMLSQLSRLENVAVNGLNNTGNSRFPVIVENSLLTTQQLFNQGMRLLSGVNTDSRQTSNDGERDNLPTARVVELTDSDEIATPLVEPVASTGLSRRNRLSTAQ